MPLRFRRSLRIFPGLRLNASKSGISASVGRRGAWFTIGPRGTRTTIGIPGTGISYTEQQSARPAQIETRAAESPPSRPWAWLKWLALILGLAVVANIIA